MKRKIAAAAAALLILSGCDTAGPDPEQTKEPEETPSRPAFSQIDAADRPVVSPEEAGLEIYDLPNYAGSPDEVVIIGWDERGDAVVYYHPGTRSVRLAPLEGQADRFVCELTPERGDIYPFSVAWHEGRILYLEDDLSPERGEWSLYVVDADGERRRIDSEADHPDYAPFPGLPSCDGDRAVWIGGGIEHSRAVSSIFCTRLDVGGREVVARLPADGELSFGGAVVDGDFVYYDVGNYSGDRRVYMYNLSGGGTEELPAPGELSDLAAAGGALAARDAGSGDILLYDFAAGEWLTALEGMYSEPYLADGWLCCAGADGGLTALRLADNTAVELVPPGSDVGAVIQGVYGPLLCWREYDAEFGADWSFTERIALLPPAEE